MPKYDYRCHTCDDSFELMRPMSQSSEPATCPQGHEGARRLLSAFASVGNATPGADPVSSWTGSDTPSGGCCGGVCGGHAH
ncbi:MAG: FmdB family zinc ribbon protein [Acidimicrobiales bacterium]|jgi:putative FmdB family regulatory protein